MWIQPDGERIILEIKGDVVSIHLAEGYDPSAPSAPPLATLTRGEALHLHRHLDYWLHARPTSEEEDREDMRQAFRTVRRDY
jgi:hypothetical protein